MVHDSSAQQLEGLGDRSVGENSRNKKLWASKRGTAAIAENKESMPYVKEKAFEDAVVEKGSVECNSTITSGFGKNLIVLVTKRSFQED